MSYPSTGEVVAENIRVELARQRRTQDWLAGEAAIYPQTLSRALNGKRSFGVDELDRIAASLDVTVSYLLTPSSRRESA